MGKFTLVLFPDEKRALQGFHALEGLHGNGRVSVRGTALVERDERGVLSLRKETGGMLVGHGLSTVVARAPKDLLEFLTQDLAPGTFALVAELSNERIAPIDARMEPLGGRVVTEWRTGSGDGALQQRTK